jgi:hypothetical protein
LRLTRLGISKKRPRRAERLSRQLGDGERASAPRAQRETLSAPRVRLLPSTGRDSFCGSPQIALRHRQLGIGSRRGQARERVSAILLSYVLRPLDGGDDASVVQDAIYAIAGAGARNTSSISTAPPSPVIASSVRRFMIKSSMEKRAKRPQNRPGIAPEPSSAFRGPEIRSCRRSEGHRRPKSKDGQSF